MLYRGKLSLSTRWRVKSDSRATTPISLWQIYLDERRNARRRARRRQSRRIWEAVQALRTWGPSWNARHSRRGPAAASFLIPRLDATHSRDSPIPRFSRGAMSYITRDPRTALLPRDWSTISAPGVAWCALRAPGTCSEQLPAERLRSSPCVDARAARHSIPVG